MATHFNRRSVAVVLLPLALAFTCTFSAGDQVPGSLCKVNQKCSSLEIKYPFHLYDGGPTFCGYEGFNVSCDHGKPLMKILGDDFYLESVSYGMKIFSVVDTDVEGNSCPRVQHSFNATTLSSSFEFPYTTNTFLGFFFNCSDPFVQEAAGSVIDCFASIGGKKSYVITSANTIEGMDIDKSTCEDFVSVVARRDIVSNTTRIGEHFSKVLQAGFVLGWQATPFCDACEKSNGSCGYNTTLPTTPICICNGNITKSSTCSISSSGERPSKSNSKVRKAVIAACSAVAILLIACISTIICVRSKIRNYYSPSSLLSRSISSDPSWKNSVGRASQYFGVHIFSFAELEDATDNFDEAREIGDGGFGAVYYGKLRDGRAVAVKRLYESNYRRVEQFMNEVGILARLSHRHLVTLYGCTSRHSRDLLLVYEYVENGTVSEHLHGKKAKSGGLPWMVRMNIAVETASALAYLHASDIIHRDVKTSNILLDDNFRVKVADFGLSRFFPLDATHVSTAPQGTPGYVDPEYHQCYQLTEKSDVYSFGVVLAELISSLPAVDITRPRQEINLSNMAIERIQNGKLHELVDSNLGFHSDATVKRTVTAAAELGFRCLQAVKEMRPGMAEVHETLRKIQAIGEEEDELRKVSEVPFSPVSVVTKWNSHSSTPNISS